MSSITSTFAADFYETREKEASADKQRVVGFSRGHISSSPAPRCDRAPYPAAWTVNPSGLGVQRSQYASQANTDTQPWLGGSTAITAYQHQALALALALAGALAGTLVGANTTATTRGAIAADGAVVTYNGVGFIGLKGEGANKFV